MTELFYTQGKIHYEWYGGYWATLKSVESSPVVDGAVRSICGELMTATRCASYWWWGRKYIVDWCFVTELPCGTIRDHQLAFKRKLFSDR